MAPPRCARRALLVALGAAALASRATADTWVSVFSDGSGDYTSVQAALDALAPGVNGTQLGHVYVAMQGLFRERVVVYSNFTGGVTFIGYGATPEDSLITFNVSGSGGAGCTGSGGPGTFGSYTVRVDAANVTMVNVAVANSACDYQHHVAGQSVALHLNADTFACWNCSLLGAQDTFYTGPVTARSYLQGSYVNGSCDALFGDSSTVFERCAIDMVDTMSAHRGNGSTAYLVQNSVVTSSGSLYLGRPWGPNATTVLINNTLAAGVERIGWDE